MSWAAVASASTTYSTPSDEENNYVVVGYVANGYISGAAIWGGVSNTSTTWA